MYVVDRVQEVAKVSTCGLDQLIVAKVTEEPHETAPEEDHKVVDASARDGG